MLSDMAGGLIGEGGGVLRRAVSRGIPEMLQETGQGALSDTLAKRKPDGTPYTWGDMVRAFPETAGKIPETMWNEGVPAGIAAMLFGAGESLMRAPESKESKLKGAEPARVYNPGPFSKNRRFSDLPGAEPAQTTSLPTPPSVEPEPDPQRFIKELEERAREKAEVFKAPQAPMPLFDIMNANTESAYVSQFEDEEAASAAEAARRFAEWNAFDGGAPEDGGSEGGSAYQA